MNRLTLCLCLCASGVIRADDLETENLGFLDEIDYSFWVDWSSRHSSRGRDYLNGKGAFSQGIYLGAGHIGLELDRSGAMDDGTKEFNLDLYYYREFERFSMYAGYEYSDWATEDFQVDGQGLEFGMTYFDFPAGFWVSGDVEYSIDRNGFFSELSMGADLELNDWVTLRPSVSVGFNSGYVNEGHDGWNHVVAGLAADFFVTDTFQVTASAAYNWAINRETNFVSFPDDVILNDFFFAGLTVAMDGSRPRSKKRRATVGESWEVTFGTSTWVTAWDGAVSIGPESLGAVEEVDDSYEQVHTGLSMEARRGRWSFLVAGSDVSFGAEIPPPLPIFVSTPVEVRLAGIGLAAGYRFWDEPVGGLDLLIGARYQRVEAEYQLSALQNRRSDWIDPMLGLRGRVALAEGLALTTQVEVGVSGVGSATCWQVQVGLDYAVSDRFAVELNFQSLELDDSRDDAETSFSFKGPKIGVIYRF
ncbi:MAG: DUF481 domain-containing protein [Akkermansiaceae bacterium]